MAQPGDTITYTYSGSKETEDISSVDEIEILYVDAPSGGDAEGSSSSGGRVENVMADVSNESTLYIWVGGRGVDGFGRYENEGVKGGASSEISVLNTDSSDSGSEPFISAAGGGAAEFFFISDGARGGNAQGTEPPAGGRSGSDGGEGAVSGHGSPVPINDSGTTIKGGGSSPFNNGEVRIAYKQSLSPPDPPSNLSAEVQ